MGTEATPTFLLDRKWPFRIALAVWLAAGVGAWFLADILSGPGQVVLAGLWLVGLGLVLRQFVVSLFGPVLAYDVLRAGRKSRRIWFRVAYVVLLALLFAWVYIAWYESARWRGEGEIRPKDLSRLAETYFGVYMVVQFIMVCLLTPASVAGAIAEEKERRTLEFLLATDLRDREILFGKFASRFGGILLFILAGLPVLGLLQFFGGIDPDLVVVGVTATLVSALSLAAVSIAASVLSRKARDAIALTYLLVVAYMLLSFAAFGVGAALSGPPLNWNVRVLGSNLTPMDAAYPFVAGNPLYMTSDILIARSRGGGDLFTALRHYTLFHAVVIAMFLLWADRRLRAIALLQAFGSTGRSVLRRMLKPVPRSAANPARSRLAASRKTRPEVGDSPVLWKEVCVDTGMRMGGVGRVVILLLVGISFVPVLVIFWVLFIDEVNTRDLGSLWSAARWREFGQAMNVYLRVVGTMATTLVFLAIAIRGAGAISGERDRHALDALLTTPMSARTIVWGKWWGCILGMRWAWAWIFFLWVLGLASGGVHPIMFPAAVVSTAVYASGFAWIGLTCSVYMKSTLRATMAAVMASLFVGGGYYLLFVMCCVMPIDLARVNDQSASNLLFHFLSSFSPPVNLAQLPIHDFGETEQWMQANGFLSRPPDYSPDLYLPSSSTMFWDLPFGPFWLLGLVAWFILSWVLSRACLNKFRRMANRGPAVPEFVPRSRRLPPPQPSELVRE
jgi:ABC-type transport system involved in multi-copper enzyme maturation permease subunit